MTSTLSLSTWQQFRLDWRRCNRILRLLHERTELEELIAWAEQKRLTKTVGRAYNRKLMEREHELSMLMFRYPGVTRWAWVLYWINRLVSGETRYYKGHAAKYRHSYELA